MKCLPFFPPFVYFSQNLDHQSIQQHHHQTPFYHNHQNLQQLQPHHLAASNPTMKSPNQIHTHLIQQTSNSSSHHSSRQQQPAQQNHFQQPYQNINTSASTIQGPPILQSTLLSSSNGNQYQEQFERNSSNEYSNNINLQYDDSSIVGSATDL